jgi:galactose mutarotase-like enzyme
MNNYACSLSVREIEGYSLLMLENEHIRISLNMGQGAHIFEFTDKKTGVNVLYKDPKGLFQYDVGGWYELFPNAGKACVYQDIQIPKHGDIQHLAWRYTVTEETDYRIEIRLFVESSIMPLRLEKMIAIESGRSALFIGERITNISLERQPYLWGHHVTFGEPFVDSSCRIDLPACRIFKRPDYDSPGSRLIAEAAGSLTNMPGRDGASLDLSYYPDQPASEMLFTEQLQEHWYNVYNTSLGLGFGLSWDGVAYPYLWIWEENRYTSSAPFFGKVCGLALEPQSSNVPILADAVYQGKAPMLEAGESRESWLTAVIHHHEQPIVGMSREGGLKL